MQLAQLGAMARYEFLMHWRRRVMVVATLSLASVCAFALAISAKATQELATTVGTSVDFSGIDIVPYFGLIVYFVMIGLFTPIAADAIPLDRHHGIHELISTLPLRRGTYLLGKLAGMFVSVLFGLFLAMAILAVVARIALGPFDLISYIQMWLIAAFPLAILNPGLSLLAAAGQPSRKRAALIGGVIAVLCFMSFTASVNASLAGNTLSIWDLLNPARPAVLRYLMPSVGGVIPDLWGMILLTLAFGILELVLAGTAIWMWMQWRDSRA